jgi:hypothetical protein
MSMKILSGATASDKLLISKNKEDLRNLVTMLPHSAKKK